MTAPTFADEDELARVEARAEYLRARVGAQQRLAWLNERMNEEREFLGADSASPAAASNGHAPTNSGPDTSPSSSTSTDPGFAPSQSGSPEDLGHALGRGKARRVVGAAAMAASAPWLFTPAAPLALGALGIAYMMRRSGVNARAQAVQNSAPDMTAKEARASASRGGISRTVGGSAAILGAGGAGYALLAGASVASAGFLIPVAAAGIGMAAWARGRGKQHNSAAAHSVPAQTRDQIKKGLGGGKVARTVGTGLIAASPFLGPAGFAALPAGMALRHYGKKARTSGLEQAGMSEAQAKQVGKKAPVRRTLGVAAMGLGAIMAARSDPGLNSKLPGVVVAGLGALLMKSGHGEQRVAAARETGTPVNPRAGEASTHQAEDLQPPPVTPRVTPTGRNPWGSSPGSARPHPGAAGWPEHAGRPSSSRRMPAAA